MEVKNSTQELVIITVLYFSFPCDNFFGLSIDNVMDIKNGEVNRHSILLSNLFSFRTIT